MINIKLDYTLETPEERKKLVEQILTETEKPTNQYLEILADYILLAVEKEERRKNNKHAILTPNRKATIDKHETSYEGLCAKFENGEDGVQELISESNKNVLFRPKKTISKKDIEEIPELRAVQESITFWTGIFNKSEGRDRYIAKNAIIEQRKDQYLVRDAFRQPVVFQTLTHTTRPPTYLPSKEWVENGEVRYSGVSFCDPKVVLGILNNYARLWTSGYGDPLSDTWYIMLDFDKLIQEALAKDPIYSAIVVYRIHQLSNEQIAQILKEDFGVSHSSEYISTLWCQKIPNKIADCAQEKVLNNWYLYEEKGKWKKCNRCGQIKLAHPRFFSSNSSSKDGFYSICKECRNKRK